MKIALIYMSHHGTTETVSQRIQSQLQPLRVELLNLAKKPKINWNDYDLIILGSSIHAGKNQANMRNFCQKYQTELLEKPLRLFLCCLNKSEYEQNKANAYPEILRTHAVGVHLMGGEYRLDRMSFVERFIIKKIAKVTESKSLLLNENITTFVEDVKAFTTK